MMAISKQRKKDVGPHQSMFITPYSCTFQVYHFENYHKGYLNLSKEIMFSIIWNWIQRYKPGRYCKQTRCKLSEFIMIDETLIRVVGSDYVWLWVAIKPTDRTILSIRISIERNILVAEQQFIQSLIK